MKTFDVFIPLCVTYIHQVQAEDEESAIDKAMEDYDNGFMYDMNYDPEHSQEWWASEEE